MRTKTKALVLALCAVLLTVTTVFVTMAFLTSQDAVQNTFTVGEVTISLDELDVDDSDNDGSTEDRDQANAYKLIPGKTYTKDPTIHVSATSEDCYLFVTVKNDIAAIEASTNTIAAQLEANGWVEVEDGVYGYGDAQGNKQTVAAGTDVPVFAQFTISGDVENDQLANYATNADKTTNVIEVNAYAIQAEGFEDATMAELWEELSN